MFGDLGFVLTAYAGKLERCLSLGSNGDIGVLLVLPQDWIIFQGTSISLSIIVFDGFGKLENKQKWSLHVFFFFLFFSLPFIT